MKKEIKFSLVFRDMWQSAGKYVPRVDQLVKVAPAIIEMGCFARVETNGGFARFCCYSVVPELFTKTVAEIMRLIDINFDISYGKIVFFKANSIHISLRKGIF